MAITDMINNMLAYTMVQTWTAMIKLKERDLGVRVRGGLRNHKDGRQLRLVAKVRREVIWQVEITGQILDIAKTVNVLNDKEERPSFAWYDANHPVKPSLDE